LLLLLLLLLLLCLLLLFLWYLLNNTISIGTISFTCDEDLSSLGTSCFLHLKDQIELWIDKCFHYLFCVYCITIGNKTFESHIQDFHFLNLVLSF
jgi:hypothetical protein